MSHKVVLMDLDGTIIYEEAAKRGGYKAVCNRLGVEFKEEEFKAFIEYENRYWFEFETGIMEVPKFLKTFKEKMEWARSKRFMDKFPIETFEIGLEIEDFYSKKLADNAVLIEKADEFIKYLSKKYRLVIATNGPLIAVEDKLKNVGVFDYFSDIVVAEVIEAVKPKKEFFHKLMKQIDFYDRSQMAIIGDGLSSDILGGVAMNIDTYWFNHMGNVPPNDIPYTLEFKSYEELYGIF